MGIHYLQFWCPWGHSPALLSSPFFCGFGACAITKQVINRITSWKLLITSLWPDVEFLEVTWPERWRPGDELNVMDERFEGWLRETGSHDADGRRGILEPKKRDCPEKMETPHRREYAEQIALTGALSNIAHYKNVNKHKQRVCPLLLSSLVLLKTIYLGLNWAINVDTQLTKQNIM